MVLFICIIINISIGIVVRIYLEHTHETEIAGPQDV